MRSEKWSALRMRWQGKSCLSDLEEAVKKNDKCKECMYWEHLSHPMPNAFGLILIGALGYWTYYAFSEIFFAYDYSGKDILHAVIASVITLGVLLTFTIFKVIGQYYYAFITSDGKLHLHDSAPADFAENIEGKVIRIKIGGWFRTNEIVNAKGELEESKWRMKFHEKNVFTLKYEGARLKYLKPKEVFEIINLGHPIDLLVGIALNVQLRYNEANLSRLQKMNKAMLLAMLDMLVEIEEKRQTMGRSQHAKHLRLQIEQALMNSKEIKEELRALQKNPRYSTIIAELSKKSQNQSLEQKAKKAVIS